MSKTVLIFCLFFGTLSSEHPQLTAMYEVHANTTSDINEHLPIMRELAKECDSVVELGVRTMVATWAFLLGLSESDQKNLSYTGVDLSAPPLEKMELAKQLAEYHGIFFEIVLGNDLKIQPPETDLLFIDTFHTYCHLTSELELYAPHTHKYITLHDTSAPYGHSDEYNNYNMPDTYAPWIDRTKRGLWPAVEDFLQRHPDEWVLQERRYNNHGFTILRRVSS